MVTVRWNMSFTSNAPTNIVISATKPLNPGRPRLASPAITYPTARNGIIFMRPRIWRMSRVCVRPYIIPMRAKNSAVMSPCDSICSIAPVQALFVIMSMANSTSPQCETDEYALMYLRSVWLIALSAPYTTLIVVSMMNIHARSSAACGRRYIAMRKQP